MKSAVLSAGIVAFAAVFASQPALAQTTPPYLLPYTIQSLAGGGATPTVGATCTGANGVTGTAYDAFGDGCPISSGAVIVGASNNIHDVVVDQQGNIFFIDDTGSNGTVRRIDARTGIVTLYAGSLTTQTVCTATTVYDKYGDGCPANDGKANFAGGYTGNFAIFRGLGLAPNGDLYIADYGGYLIHKISRATGVMTVVAGALASGTKATSIGGSKGYGSDNVVAFGQPTPPALTPSAQSALLSPRGVTVDAAGNIYIADSGNNVVRKVTASTGVISTIVGANPNNLPAPPPPASAETAARPTPHLSCSASPRMSRSIPSAISSSPTCPTPASASFTPAARRSSTSSSKPTAPPPPPATSTPSSATASPPPATSRPPAPRSPPPSPSAPRASCDSTAAAISTSRITATTSSGSVDASTGYMRVIAGTIGATVPPALCTAHSDAFGDNCPATTAALNSNSDMGVTVDSFGNILVTDPLDSRLRRVNTNQVFPAAVANASTTQTIQIHFAAGDGPATSNPYIITPGSDFAFTSSATCNTNPDNTQDCLLNIAFTPTVAGTDTANLTITSKLNGASTFALSGVATAPAVALDPGSASLITTTTLKSPSGVALDLRNSTYIADTGNNRVVAYAYFGAQTLIAGNGTAGYTGDNASGALATLNGPKAVVTGPTGLIYIADTGNNVIRRVDPASGIITTIAGGATTVCTLASDAVGDGCPATQATFSKPAGLAIDSDGNLYVSDSGNSLIREVTASGFVFLVAGGTPCAAGDTYGNSCLATQATFKNPTALALDLGRNIYVADTGDNFIRKITSGTGIVTAVAGNGQPGSSGNNGPATSAQLNGPTGLAVDAAANIYIADTGNAVVRLVNSAGNNLHRRRHPRRPRHRHTTRFGLHRPALQPRRRSFKRRRHRHHPRLRQQPRPARQPQHLLLLLRTRQSGLLLGRRQHPGDLHRRLRRHALRRIAALHRLRRQPHCLHRHLVGNRWLLRRTGPRRR